MLSQHLEQHLEHPDHRLLQPSHLERDEETILSFIIRSLGIALALQGWKGKEVEEKTSSIFECLPAAT